jgi:glutamate/tyrosine decarboxylase-like PLP-dependent enzyme
VPDPISGRGELNEVLRLVQLEAEVYLDAVDTATVRPPGGREPAAELPIDGVGSLQAISELIAASMDGATRSAGPRYFHYVTGGVTAAALGADWLASALDQHAYNWVSSPLSLRLEQISLGWLKELFGIPAEWSAVLTTGATASNFVGLASARRWWGLKQQVDIDSDGFAGLPPVPVFASGYLHASAIKALGMLGIGRRQPRILTRDAAGRLDVAALGAALEGLDENPRSSSLPLVTSTPVTSIRWPTWRTWHALTGRGCTWTGRSACSPRFRRRRGTWCEESKARTRWRWTGTNG